MNLRLDQSDRALASHHPHRLKLVCRVSVDELLITSPRTKAPERFKPNGRREPGDSDALTAFASNKLGVCEHSHDSAVTLPSQSGETASLRSTSRPIAHEMATCQCVRDIYPEHARVSALKQIAQLPRATLPKSGLRYLRAYNGQKRDPVVQLFRRSRHTHYKQRRDGGGQAGSRAP